MATELDLTIFPRLESYLIILNLVFEGAIYLFYSVIFKNNNFSSVISTTQFGIISVFFGMFIVKSYFLSYSIKKMQVNQESEDLIKLKETEDIKYSILLELSQISMKIYGILDF